MPFFFNLLGNPWNCCISIPTSNTLRHVIPLCMCLCGTDVWKGAKAKSCPCILGSKTLMDFFLFVFLLRAMLWFQLFHCNWKAACLSWATHKFSVLFYCLACCCRILGEFKLRSFLFCRLCRWVKQDCNQALYVVRKEEFENLLLFSRGVVFLEEWYLCLSDQHSWK